MSRSAQGPIPDDNFLNDLDPNPMPFAPYAPGLQDRLNQRVREHKAGPRKVAKAEGDDDPDGADLPGGEDGPIVAEPDAPAAGADDDAFSVERPEAERAQIEFKALMKDLLDAAAKEAIAKVIEQDDFFEEATGSPAEPGADPLLLETWSKQIANELEMGELLEELTKHSALRTAMQAMMVDSSQAAIAQVGVDMTAELADVVNEEALQYLRDRGAELVGKKWIDGELVDNPSTQWSITESTRTALRNLLVKGVEDNIGEPAILDSIRDSFAFSDQRAEMIAKTEIAMANAGGKLNGWIEGAKASEDDWEKSWQTSNDENVCPECEGNEEQGWIDLEDDFESGDATEPAHPLCQCVTTIRRVAKDDDAPDNDEDGEDDEGDSEDG
jgi:hypothetical protein